jgi:hypothetical protein
MKTNKKIGILSLKYSQKIELNNANFTWFSETLNETHCLTLKHFFLSGSGWTGPAGETAAWGRGSTLSAIPGTTRTWACQDQQWRPGGMGGWTGKADHQVRERTGKVSGVLWSAAWKDLKIIWRKMMILGTKEFKFEIKTNNLFLEGLVSKYKQMCFVS